MPEVVDVPITYHLIKDFDIKVNILNAYISSGKEGNLAVELEATKVNLEKGLAYIKTQNVKCTPLVKKVLFNKTSCINCGSCTAVCFAGALTMNKETWQLEFDHKKCIVCELCTTACPIKLFKIDFVE